MNKADVLFLDIYHSIRGGWGTGVIQRGEVMIALLPQTTLTTFLQDWFKTHFEEMIQDFSNSPYSFDGRDWARDSGWSYDELMRLEWWFDEEFYHCHTIYNGVSEIDGYERFFEMFPAFNNLHWEIVIEKPTEEARAKTAEAIRRFLEQ